MRKLLLAALLVSSLAHADDSAGAANTLTRQEKSAGWRLLFDGKTMKGWLDPATQNPPGDSWMIEDGCLKARPDPRITEDLVSRDTYRDFELAWEWRITPNGNSGVKYRIQDFVALTPANHHPTSKKFEDWPDYVLDNHLSDRTKMGTEGKGQVYVIGFEYQMIDNDGHPDARRGPLYQTGSLYSMLPPTEAAAKPVGEFNQSRLVVKGTHVEHWLNGRKVVDATLDAPEVKETLLKRWKPTSPVYRLLTTQPKQDCPISLQNHGNTVWFRSLKIRKL